MSKIADVLIDHEERYRKAKDEYFLVCRRMLLIGWNYDDYIAAVECVGRMHAVALSAVKNFGDDRWMTDYKHTNVEEHLLTELGLA